MSLERIKIFSGNANPSLSSEIIENLNITQSKAFVGQFSDGESQVEILDNVRGCDVFIIQPTCGPSSAETLMELLAVVLPPSTNEITFQTLEDIISNPRGGLLSVGFILALYFSTNGINSLIEAFNSSYHIREIRPLIQQRILSLGLTLLLSIMLIIAIGLIIFGTVVVNYLVSSEIITTGAADLIIYGKWFVMLAMLFFGISILFHLGPALKSKWKLFTPGSIFATIFIIITSIGFNYYINHFSQYNKIYGSIGTLMIILLWMYFNSIILLTGFELNASISNAKQKRINSE
jgi:membrane protein